MRPARHPRQLILFAVCAIGVAMPPDLRAQSLEARVWIDRGAEPIVQQGERVRIYYRTNVDAYVAILQIDTDGRTRLLYPRTPDEDNFVRGDREHRLLFPRSPYWNVDDAPGMGYFFAVASPEPMDLSGFRYSHRRGGWDLTPVGAFTYRDPYEAIDDFVEFMIPEWEYVDYGLDFATYHVEQRHQYPRFMCYQCHGYRSYSSWNPYLSACTSFRVVVYNDPYFYPSQRYRGDRVVYVRPETGRPRYVFKERAAGEAGTPTVRPRPVEDRRAVPRRRVNTDRSTQTRSRVEQQAVDRRSTTTSLRDRGSSVSTTRSGIDRSTTGTRRVVPSRTSTSRPSSGASTRSPALRPEANRGRLLGGGSVTRSPDRTSPRSGAATRRIVPSRSSTPRSVPQSRPTLQRTPTRSRGGSSARPARPTPRASTPSVKRSGGSSRGTVRSAPSRPPARAKAPAKSSGGSKPRRGGGGGGVGPVG